MLMEKWNLAGRYSVQGIPEVRQREGCGRCLEDGTDRSIGHLVQDAVRSCLQVRFDRLARLHNTEIRRKLIAIPRRNSTYRTSAEMTSRGLL